MEIILRKPKAVFPPVIYLEAVPTDERANTLSVFNSLNYLNQYIANFYSALDLFDHVEGVYETLSASRYAALMRLRETSQNPDFEGLQINSDKIAVVGHWPFFAAQEAAMSAYHFVRVCEGINLSLGGCTMVRSWVNKALLKEANKIRETHFATFIKVRAAMSHQAETKNTPAALARHLITKTVEIPGIVSKEGLGGMLISSCLKGRKYISTWEKEAVEFEVSVATGELLEAIRDKINDAFLAATLEAKKIRLSRQP